MTKKIFIDEAVVKQTLEWIENATVVLSHTSTAIQGGLGAEAEGVGGCSVRVIKDLREALVARPINVSVMPCGSTVANVYEAYEAGKRAVQQQAAQANNEVVNATGPVVGWVLLREDADGFEPIMFYGGKEKPEGEFKDRFTLRPIRFADATQQPLTEWEPIETAPQDGTEILGYRDGKIAVAYRVPRDDCEMWAFGGTSAAIDIAPYLKPTHWMRIPAPPVEAANHTASTNKGE